MKWSWKLGKFAGIDVKIHTTFLLLLGWIGFSSWLEEPTLFAVLSGVGFILALFLSVVLHEYGHALTARRFGVQTKDITLYPIGGVARLERIPDVPIQELWVSLAGPAVNLVIAAVLFAGMLVTASLEPLSSLTLTGGSFVERLMLTNLVLVGFNMLPAFPMDGGRVLRALLALRMEYPRATQIAANVGQLMALLFGIVGFFSNPFLVFIAVFVWMGAGAEAQAAKTRHMLKGVPVARVMRTEFQTLSPYEPLPDVADRMLANPQPDYPVTLGGEVVGVLPKEQLLQGLQAYGQKMVSEVMQPDFEPVNAYDRLDEVLARFQSGAVRSLVVLRDGALAGLLTLENINEYIRIQSLLDARGAMMRS